MRPANTTTPEPETLTPESVAGIATETPAAVETSPAEEASGIGDTSPASNEAPAAGTVDARKPDPWLDPVAEYLKGGAMPAARILAQVYRNEFADAESIAALDRQMAADPRFRLLTDGSGWDLEGLPPASRTIGEIQAQVQAEAAAAPVAPVEGTGSETIASDTPAPVVVDPKDEEIRRLRRKLDAACDELDAFRERAEKEKELTDAINRASRDVEAAKEVLAGKKAALATAHEQLFLHASGDTQTTHPDLREPEEEDEHEDDQGRPAPVVTAPTPATTQAVAESVAPATTGSAPAPAAEAPAADPAPFHETLAADQIIVDHGKAAEGLELIVMRELAPTEKPHQVGPNVIELRGCQWLVRDSSPDGRRWFLQRVLSKDEWQQLHEKEFGLCVTGFDQNQEAKQVRTAGGDDCGRVVRVGRKLGVLGPEREGLVLVVEAPKQPPATEETDGKSAGAGDALRSEQEQFVAGDTPGGVVNSDPND